MNNAVCIACRLNDTDQRFELDAIWRIVRRYRIEPSKESLEHIPWQCNLRCKYGITCPKVRQLVSTFNNETRNLTPYVVSIARYGDEMVYRELWNIFRGRNPETCHALERIRHSR